MEAPASLLELQHDNREMTQQVEMLRETLAIIKVTMSRNDALLQEKIRLLDEKTSECERLKIKCEGLVREKAAAVALWKKKYEALVAKDEQETIQRLPRSTSPNTLSGSGILPNHPWREHVASVIVPSNPEVISDSSESENDSVADPPPLAAAFPEHQHRRLSNGSRSSHSKGSNHSSQSSRRSLKVASSTKEFSAFTPLAMQWANLASTEGENEATLPSPLDMQWPTSEVTSWARTLSLDTEQDVKVSFDIEEGVEHLSMREASCDESSITNEGFDDDLSESQETTILLSDQASKEMGSEALFDDGNELNHQNDQFSNANLEDSCIFISSEIDFAFPASPSTDVQATEMESELDSLWDDGEEHKCDWADSDDDSINRDGENEDDLTLPMPEMDIALDSPKPFEDDNGDEGKKQGHTVLIADPQTSDKNYTVSITINASIADAQTFDIVPTTIDEGTGTCVSSSEKEPLFDKKTARLLRRRMRHAARIRRTAHKAAALAGHEIVQLEC